MLTSPARSLSALGEINVYSYPSAPRTIGGVLDDAIHLFRESLPRSWPLALLAQSGAIFANLNMSPEIRDGATIDPQAVLHALPSGGILLSAAVGMILGLIGNCAVIDHVHGIATGKRALASANRSASESGASRTRSSRPC